MVTAYGNVSFPTLIIPLSSYLGSFKRKVLLFEAGFAYQRQRDIILIQACNPIRGEGGGGGGERMGLVDNNTLRGHTIVVLNRFVTLNKVGFSEHSCSQSDTNL